MIEKLRSGAFLSPERLRVYPLILIVAYALSLAALVAGSHGGMDALQRPIGTDFSQVYAAGVFAQKGEPAKPFDNAAHAAMQRSLFGAATPFYSWGYPPYFLAVAALLASLPYLAALLVWQGATLSIYLAAMWRILPLPGTLTVALAYPAVYINVTHGQNGFLTAGLMGGALLLVEKRPWLAGALLGLTAYKPQFCLLLPVALIAGRQWQCIASGALTVAAMTLATLFAFGVQSWTAFLDSLPFSREVVIEQGATGFEKFQTVFGAVRLLGGSVHGAYAAQGIAAFACAAILAALWRSDTDQRLCAAALLSGALLATPYALDYDMMMLGPAIALLVSYGLEHGFRPYEKLILAVAFCMPLIARSVAGATGVPIGVVSVVLLFALAPAKAFGSKRSAARPAAGLVERPSSS